MPPRLNFYTASRSLAIRSRPPIALRAPRILQTPAARRGFADEKTPKPESTPAGLGHVSEEAAEVGQVTGSTQPDLEQGTPVQEIFERDNDLTKDKTPEIIKKDINQEKQAAEAVSFENLLALGQLQNVAAGGAVTDPVDVNAGHKFDLPILPIPSDANLKYRYDPVVSQVIKLMMEHGKLGAAQRNMGYILNHLRTAPPPTTNPTRPLLPGTPPAHHLPLNPVLYLTTAIDSVAPLLRMRALKGAAGGGASLPIPTPLSVRQRRRTAITWILDAARKRASRAASGRGQFAQRVADEIISVVEGKSTAWDKRGLLHKQGTTARSNLNFKKGKRR